MRTHAWTPRKWVRHSADAADDLAARALQRFVHELPARLVAAGIAKPKLVNGNVVNAAHAPHLPGPCRAWRFRFEAHELWCVAAEKAQRNILHCVLQGPASPELTCLEQSIVTQWLRTLVASQSAADDAAEDVATPEGESAWRCDVDVLQTGWPTIRLHFLTAASAPTPADRDARVRLDNVTIRMTALVPLGSAALNDIVSWAPGTRVMLRGIAAPLTAGLFIGSRRIAAVEIGSLAGERAVRLARMAPSSVGLNGAKP